MSLPKILVFGSINVDLVARVASIPRPGETVLSPSYDTVCGGKGANQAVAAARIASAGTVTMVGRVGEDGFGRLALENLRENGVDVAHLAVGPEPTGAAFITVDAAGENAITVASGANRSVSAEAVPEELLEPGTITVLQMEVPFAASLAVARRTRGAGGRTLWNYAPAPADFQADDFRALLEAADIIIVNEHEAIAAARLLGRTAALDAAEASAWLARTGGVVTALTAGAEGARAFAPDGTVEAAHALPIRPVDTTGAGDTFVGILAAELAAGKTLATGLGRACIGASLACLAAGAQAAMPTEEDLRRAELSVGR